MTFLPTKLPGVLLIEPKVFHDARGFFLESYSKKVFKENGITVDFVQDNHSRSADGTLRGLHYQVPPQEQAKLVHVVRGEIFDVVLDLRAGSKTFGQWEAHTLSEANRKILFIPAGLAHGFLALADGTEMIYKVSKVYSPRHERGILWKDPSLGIPWPKRNTTNLISKKDKKFPTMKEARI